MKCKNYSKIVVKNDSGMIAEACNNIIYCKARRNYTELILTNNKSGIVSESLKSIEEKFSENCFFRVNNNCIVNMNYFKEILSKQRTIVMANGDEIKVSVRKKTKFMQKLKVVKTCPYMKHF